MRSPAPAVTLDARLLAGIRYLDQLAFATPLLARLPGFIFDKRMGPYGPAPGRWRHTLPDGRLGKLVSKRDVRTNVLALHERSRRNLSRLGTAVADGRISPAVFQRSMRNEIKMLHCASASLAWGSPALVPRDARGRVTRDLRSEFGHLSAFRREIEAGNLSAAQIAARSGLYTDNAYGRYYQEHLTEATDGGANAKRNVTSGDERVCDQCRREASEGWVEINSSRVGTPPLHLGCRCGQETGTRDLSAQRKRVTPTPPEPTPVLPAPTPVLPAPTPVLPAPTPPLPTPAVAAPRPITPAPAAAAPAAPPSGLRYTVDPRQVEKVEQLARADLIETAKKRGISATEALNSIGEISTRLAEELAVRPISVRVPYDVFPKVLKSGGFKSQFETATSRGTLNTTTRARAEKRGLGIPTDAPAKTRPVYGYVELSESYNGAMVGGYGEVQVVMKEQVRDRATYTIGDSLYDMGENKLVGSPLTGEATIGSWDERSYALLDWKDAGYAPNHLQDRIGYLETQIQGGASVDEIAYVLDPIGLLDTSTMQELARRGIPVSKGKRVNRLDEGLQGLDFVKDVPPSAIDVRRAKVLLDESVDVLFDKGRTASEQYLKTKAQKYGTTVEEIKRLAGLR